MFAIPVVFVVVALVTSSLAFPSIPTKQVTPEGVPQVYSGVPQTVVPEPEVQGSSEVQAPSEQVTHLEKTEAEVPSEAHPFYNQESSFVSKVQSVPVNVEQVQTSYTESSVLLPVQPLSVVNQADQEWRPIVLPAEAIADERIIIAAAEPTQQRIFRIIPKKHASQHQEPTQVQPNQQTHFQSVEDQNPVQQKVQPTVHNLSPAQVQFKEEPISSQQTVPVIQEVQKTIQSVEKQNQEPVEQVYSVVQNVQPVEQVYSVVQNVQPVVTDNVEHQVQTYSGEYTPDKTQSYQRNFSVQPQDNQVQPVVENVKQQVTQNVVPDYYHQQVTEEQTSKCGQVQNQLVEASEEPVATTKTENQEQNDYASVQTIKPQQHQVQTFEKQGVQQPGQVQKVEPVYEGQQEENRVQSQTTDQTSKSSQAEPNNQVFNQY